MNVEFRAEEVEVGVSPQGVINVGFYTDGNYLSFQYMTDAEQRRRLNVPDTYYIARDDQSYGEYGGVEKITLTRNSIEVILDELGQSNVQCESVTAAFETDDKTFYTVKEKLAYIFGDKFAFND
jgi:Immunity protein 10